MQERFETFTVLINRISRDIRKIKNQEMADYHLRSAHVSCLYYVYSLGSVTSAELCEHCEEDKATISRAVDYLETNGFLLRDTGAKRYKSPLLLTDKKKNGDSTPLYQCLGGTSAEKLARYGRARADGKSLSRTAQLVCGSKTDFLFVADSGPGETNAKGLIVPRFGKNPENHVSVSMTFELFSELMLMTKTHYQSWLTAYYLQNPIKSATLPAQETYAAPDNAPNTLF